jgi:uncharacterized protein (TIGR02757 family)
MSKNKQLKDFLDTKVAAYNQPAFIKDDPVCIPHLFSKQPDIEIAALFAAVFAWGGRTTIINKSKELMQLMHMAPFDFVMHHSAADLKALMQFKHRTFNTTDLLYFIEFLRFHYTKHASLETAFTLHFDAGEDNTAKALTGFHDYFFSLEDVPHRTKKHIATPAKKSTCKRLNMFLRWMVRNDNCGVDFGLWKNISPAQLICPIDLHVARVAKRFNLIQRKQIDWETGVELTNYLRLLDASDPVKYDFALFGLGVIEQYY